MGGVESVATRFLKDILCQECWSDYDEVYSRKLNWGHIKMFFVCLKCLFQGWMKRRWRNGETQRIFFKSFRELRIFWLITSHSSCLSAKLTCLRLGGDSWGQQTAPVHLLSASPALDPRTQTILRRDNPQPLDTAVEVQNIDMIYIDKVFIQKIIKKYIKYL